MQITCAVFNAVLDGPDQYIHRELTSACYWYYYLMWNLNRDYMLIF